MVSQNLFNHRRVSAKKPLLRWFFPVIIFSFSLVLTHCTKNQPIPLVPELVDPADNTTPAGSIPGDIPPDQLNSLFTFQPGQVMAISSFGVVDPVGTSLSGDFDGDAITNDKESISNIWVADYPMIDTSIAPPITMEIQILKDTLGQTNKIINNIASTDFESRRDNGSEKFHQKELARKTVQFTVSKQYSTKKNDSVNLGLINFGGSKEESGSTTEDVFQTKPFRNNIDRNASSVRSNSALNNARKYRQEKTTKVKGTAIVEPNAGIVRAALYIKNHSVNMPVRLSNILCSLLFETAEGELIPIQSFKLRNADYSEFVIEVYGASEFGPYVIELAGLNTVEIENAIAKGYTPKIFIVDYTMTHVADSNYKTALGNTFSGNNLKVIEENAKGRTALVKLIGPFMREMYRVAAFSVDTDTNANGCGIAGQPTTVSAGVSMERVLKRIACNGVDIQFGHYIFDYTGTGFEGTNPLTYIYTVKSVGAVQNNLPCHAQVAGNDIYGQPVSACLIRLADLTQAELDAVGMWSFFHNGKYFDNARYVTDAVGNVVTFDGAIPMKEGIHSTVWAGDFYDLVYFSMADILNRKQEFGSNPFETGEVFTVNSRWSHEQLGLNPYYPNVNSIYLGQAGLGEQFQVEITLDHTWKLNPSFGVPSSYDSYLGYRNFSYNLQQDTTTLFNIDEAFDFQVSFGLGGTPGNWYNILRTNGSTWPDDNAVLDGINSCGQSWSFLLQKFTVCIELPASLAGVGADGVVNIFLRPSPNNAYRETVWPKDYRTVNRFEASLLSPSLAGESVIETVLDGGTLGVGVNENGTIVLLGRRPYRIANVAYSDRVFVINLKSQAGVVFNAGDPVTLGTFNGTLKNSVTATSTTLLVKPATVTDTLPEGTAMDGATVTAGLLNTPLTVGSIYQKNSVYSITLQTALGEDHLSGEMVSVNAALAGPKVEYQESVGFVGDWNGDPVHAQTVNIPESSAMLYSAAPAGCLYGLDNLALLSPGCQGYQVDAITANWVGAGAFQNNWSDSSFYAGWVANMVSPSAVSLNGEVVRTMPIPENNTLISSPTGRTHGASWGNKSLIVSTKNNGVDFDIVGVILDENGVAVVPEFLIGNTFQGVVTGDQIFPYVVVHGDRAFVTWSSGITLYDIHGKFIDLNNPTAGSEQVINTSDLPRHQVLSHAVITDSGKVLVTWHSSNGTDYDIRGRIYDIATGLPFAGALGSDVGDFLINTYSANDQFHSEIATFGAGNSKAFLVWYSDITPNSFNIRGRFLDIDAETWLSAELAVSTSNVNGQKHPEVIVSGDTALVTWYSNHRTVWDVMGIFYDLTTLAPTSTDFQIASVISDPGVYQITSVDANYALVCWRDSYTVLDDVNCRVADMVGRQLLGSDINVSTKTALEQAAVNSVILNGKGYVVWRSMENGGWGYRGQIIDLATQTLDTVEDFMVSDHLYPMGTEALSISITPPNPDTAVMINNGASVLAVWGNANGLYSQKLVPGSVFPLQHGLNNFFVSPLIERNYSIKSWLVY